MSLARGATETLDSRASAVLQTTAICMRVHDPNDDMLPVDGSEEGLTVDMLIAVPSALYTKPHKPVCLHTTVVCSKPHSL